MKITLFPQANPARYDYSVNGEALTATDAGGLTDTEDLSAVMEGDLATLTDAAGEPYPWLAGSITREAGEIVVPLLLPYEGEAPEAVRFPAPVTVLSGRVPLPTDEV